MTEAEWVSHWARLYEEVFIVGPPEERNREKPSEEHLHRLEAKLHIRLPASYRGFVKVFGPGFLARSFPIFAPGYRGASVVDFLGHNKWQEYEVSFRPDPEQIKRAVTFSEYGYEFIVWDTGNVTDPSGPEYRILRLPRNPDEGLLPVTDNFRSFIEEYCLRDRYTELLGGTPTQEWQDDETGEMRSIQCFEPIGGNPRSKT